MSSAGEANPEAFNAPLGVSGQFVFCKGSRALGSRVRIPGTALQVHDR